MAMLFSYVVDHDRGFAPDPESPYCTLVYCKFQHDGGHRSIVELAEVGDWVLGTGGQSQESAGNGKIIYLMCVDEKLPFRDFLTDSRFQGRRDCKDKNLGNRFALVSKEFFYFGKNAVDSSALPVDLTTDELVKHGPGFRRDYPVQKVQQLAKWFAKHYKTGVHGEPCSSVTSTIKPRLRLTCDERCR